MHLAAAKCPFSRRQPFERSKVSDTGKAVRQGDRLDRDQIRTELTPLVDLKEEPEIMTQRDALL